MGDFVKGKWKAGLFEIKCPLCLFNYCCYPCSLAQIHEKLGNPRSASPSHASLLALDSPLCRSCGTEPMKRTAPRTQSPALLRNVVSVAVATRTSNTRSTVALKVWETLS